MQDQLYIKSWIFGMPALGPLGSSLPCVVCFPYSHCLYSEPSVEYPIQAFQFQWIHYDFYKLLKINSNSAHYFSHLMVLLSITSPVNVRVSSKAIPIQSHTNIERPHPSWGRRCHHEAFHVIRKKVWSH